MPKIEAIYAYIAVDKNPDDEGVVAIQSHDTWMPLVGADKDRVESLRHYAQKIATVTKKKILLVKFSVREDIEEILPPRKGRLRP